MALDLALSIRLETILRRLPSDLSETQLERRLAGYLPLITHAAKIALCDPPLRRRGASKGAGRPLEGARELFVSTLAAVYIGITGEPPTASYKHGKFGAFVEDIFTAVPLLAASRHDPDILAHPHRIVNPERSLKAVVHRHRVKLGD